MNPACEYVEVSHCAAIDRPVDQYAARSKTIVQLSTRTVTRHEGVIKECIAPVQPFVSPAFYRPDDFRRNSRFQNIDNLFVDSLLTFIFRETQLDGA
jgi:hypothetical protein